MKRHQSAPGPGPAASAPAARAPAGGAGMAATAEDLHQRIARLAARSGVELPHRARLERRFGSDLGGVRAVRGGDEARALLAEKGAEAVASGEAVVFADADPSVELVSHEVTHVLQQRRGGGGGGEREAEEAGRGADSDVGFQVKGGAPVGPQFAKSGGASAKGKVTLTLSGASVTPPAFPGGLPDVHDWLMENQAALAGYSGKLKVRFSGTVVQDEQVIWAYYHPKQELVLDGEDGAVVTGFTESGNGKEYATPGYFLAYRPLIPQAMTAENPAAANFTMRDLTVRGFVSGGVEISPRSGTMPTGEAWAAGAWDPEAGHGDGGLTAFVSGATIEDNTFEQMGTKFLKKGKERYNPDDPEAYQWCGYGGIVARGLNYSTIAGNTFSELENRDSDETNESSGDDVNWLGLMHGVYLRDHSSHNTIRGNDFDTISGAPVKFTNASSYNKVRGNTSENAGKDAFVLDHWSSSNPGGAVEADSLGYSNDRIQTASDGRKYIAGNDLGSSYAGYGSSKRVKKFKEKHVGG